MATSNMLNEHCVKTDLCSLGDILARVPAAYKVYGNTTLNFDHNNHADVVPRERPLIRYFGVGVQGFVNSDDGQLATPFLPSNREHGLYSPIPIRMVPVSEDLTDRSLYRMRVRKEINGVPYYCYYLKALTALDTEVRITRTNPETQQEEPYIFSATDLKPTPSLPSTSGVQAATQSKVNVTYRMQLELLGSELLEVINIMFDGDQRRAKISEYGLYSGEDQIVQGFDADNHAFNYTEAIYAQMCYKICNIGNSLTTEADSIRRTYMFGDGNLILV